MRYPALRAATTSVQYANLNDHAGAGCLGLGLRSTGKFSNQIREENQMNWNSKGHMVWLSPLILTVALAMEARGQSQAAPQPPAEILSLEKALVGQWSTTYEFDPGSMGPKVTGTGHGHEVWRTSPGAFVLMEEEDIHAPFGEMFVFAIHWWDKSTNSLRGMLCNNSGPAACNVDTYSNSTLKWDGKQLTIDMQFPQK